MFQKKVISKNVTEKCTFFTFTHVRQTCFAYNFFLVHFFTIFSTDSKSAWNSAFLTAFSIKKKNNFKVILVLFSNFDCKCAGSGSKNQKTYLVNVSYISILHPSKGLYSLFSKKKSNSLYPNAHCTTSAYPCCYIYHLHNVFIIFKIYIKIALCN
jgi:hypothetical protein